MNTARWSNKETFQRFYNFHTENWRRKINNWGVGGGGEGGGVIFIYSCSVNLLKFTANTKSSVIARFNYTSSLTYGTSFLFINLFDSFHGSSTEIGLSRISFLQAAHIEILHNLSCDI